MLLTVFDKSAENTDISRNFPKKFSVCTRYRFKRNIRKNVSSKINMSEYILIQKYNIFICTLATYKGCSGGWIKGVIRIIFC